MNEVIEDRETGLCSRCRREDSLTKYYEEMLCEDCLTDAEMQEI